MTATLRTADHHRLRLAELASISETLDSISDADFDHDSLCDGWQVRHVVTHMYLGYTTPLPRMLRMVAGSRFDIPKVSRSASIETGSAMTPDQLRRGFREIHENDVRRGISLLIPASEGVTDHVIHHIDIRRPLGLTVEPDPQRLQVALDNVVKKNGMIGGKRRAAGLRLVATDLDWRAGAESGDDVRGPATDLLLALSGRPVGLDALEGPGVATLATRC